LLRQHGSPLTSSPYCERVGGGREGGVGKKKEGKEEEELVLGFSTPTETITFSYYLSSVKTRSEKKGNAQEKKKGKREGLRHTLLEILPFSLSRRASTTGEKRKQELVKKKKENIVFGTLLRSSLLIFIPRIRSGEGGNLRKEGGRTPLSRPPGLYRYFLFSSSVKRGRKVRNLATCPTPPVSFLTTPSWNEKKRGGNRERKQEE